VHDSDGEASVHRVVDVVSLNSLCVSHVVSEGICDGELWGWFLVSIARWWSSSLGAVAAIFYHGDIVSMVQIRVVK
jgi:hypothetical protein